MSDRRGKVWSLLRDLALLVSGIFLSLLLNDCRERKADARDDQRLMQQLIEDIAADTVALTACITGLQEIEENFITADTSSNSVERYRLTWGVGTYFPFRPHRVALQEITYAGRADKLKRADIVSRVMALHDGPYADLREVEMSFHRYALGDYFPFLSDRLPYISSQNLSGQQEKQLSEVLKSDDLRHRLLMMETLNWNNLNMAKEALVVARGILEDLK